MTIKQERELIKMEYEEIEHGMLVLAKRLGCTSCLHGDSAQLKKTWWSCTKYSSEEVLTQKTHNVTNDNHVFCEERDPFVE